MPLRIGLPFLLMLFCVLSDAQEATERTGIRQDPADPIVTPSVEGSDGLRCVARAHVSKAGIISDVEIEQSSGNARYDDECRRALDGHHVIPATLKGEPIEVTVRIPIVWQREEERARQSEIAAERREAEEEARQKRAAAERTRCEGTREFALFQSQEEIVRDVERKSQAMRSLEHERKVSEISGTENLTKKNWAGETIVHVDEDLEETWPKYKALGGQAASPSEVSHSVRDPCHKHSAQ
jgi:hypothetical protein